MDYTNNDLLNETCNIFLNSKWEDKNFYAEYLAQSYHYICHSTKLLALAVAYTDETQKAFYRRSIAHISEEDGHQYLAQADLRRVGFKMEAFTEQPMTRALWEPQYYKVQRENTSLLGYILGLECIAIKTFDPLYVKVREVHGDKASNFIRVHAEEDPGHVEKAIEEVDKLSDREKELINQNYIQTVVSFKQMILECQRNTNLFKGTDVINFSEAGA